MGKEIDLLAKYPRMQRPIEERKGTKTAEDRALACRFGREFFDGERRHGYGGFHYHPRFWQPVVPDFQAYYQLNHLSKILDIGCAKGFMLYDFTCLIPGMAVAGVDLSEYAITHSHEAVRPFLQVADAQDLPFETASFDLVVSINTLHNLEGPSLKRALTEMQRVSRGCCFLTVDAYRTEQEAERMWAWNLTAKTILHVDDWKALFQEVGYQGDYYWFMP